MRWRKVFRGASRVMVVVLLLSAWTGSAVALQAGQAAPNFSAKDLDGKPVSLSDLTGNKHVYLWFWASW